MKRVELANRIGPSVHLTKERVSNSNLRPFLVLVTIVTMFGCSSPPPRPSSKAMSLDEATTRLTQLSGRETRTFSTRDFGRERNSAGRSVLVEESIAPVLVAKIRAELGPGLLAFVGCTRSLAQPPDSGSEVVIAPGLSQFDIVRIAQSDAVNYDMTTEDLIRKLEEYDSKYGIDIFHAETDTIEFKFKKLPDDLGAFCKDLYQFCPDIVDQGVGTVDELEKAIAESGQVYLWWD
jgi:hypothetical protein